IEAAHAASLIGTTLTLGHYYPDTSTVLSTSGEITVGGTGDPWTWSAYTANPESTSVLVGSFTDVAFDKTDGDPVPSFNGFAVTGIDWYLTGVTVDTNFVGWDNSRISFDSHSAWFNWYGLTGYSGGAQPATYFNAYLETSREDPSIPEPSSLALLGFGLLGLFRKRKKP
ncbi:PEP-CTERM sorting domain-containing protein, partial [Candidatus Omnitrophota bacterium]